jgi:glycosyltransferase involved in cell wall biosynthesis
MRILYLCPDLGIPVLGWKGASVHVRGLASALVRAGHSVVLAAPLLNKSPWEESARPDFPVLHLPPGAETAAAAAALKEFGATLGLATSLPGELRRILYDRELRRQLRKRFDADPPDFIYERASLYATAGAELAAELGCPLLVELNAPLAVEQSAYRDAALGELAAAAERWTLSRADAVLVVSALLRDHVVSLGIESSRVHIVPNGVDGVLFRPGPRDPAVRARWGLGDGPVLGFVGGLRPWHGGEVLPALAERLARRRPDLRLVIVGNGPMRGELERDLAERGLAGRAVLTGSVPHETVAGLIRQFDVALAPYPQPEEHTFYFSPLKLFEYMGCGTAVVAARLGQIAEVVRDGETGLLYPPGDLEALTAACERLLGDPGLRSRLGQAAAEEVRGRYTWDRNAERVIELARQRVAAREAGQ